MTPSTSVPATAPPPPAAARGARFLEGAKRHVRRASVCDFTRFEPTPSERERLTHVPTPEARSYLAWRLSMAWVGFAAASVSTVIAFVEWVTAESEGVPGSLRFSQFLFRVGARAGLAFGLWSTIRRWRDPAGSRKALRLAWACGFFLPMLVGLVPLISYFPDPEPGATQEQLFAREGIKIVGGFLYLFMLAPACLSLFPGVVRAGLTVKTLWPSTAMGPTVAALFAPLYSLGFLLAIIVLQQISGSFVLVLGTALIALGPLVFVRSGLRLAAPMSRERAAREVAAVRNRARWLLGAGSLLVVVALFEMEVLGRPLIGGGDAFLSVWTLVEMAIWYVATLTAFTAVVADGIVEGATAMISRRPWWLATEEGKRAEEQIASVSIAFPAPPPPGPLPGTEAA